MRVLVLSRHNVDYIWMYRLHIDSCFIGDYKKITKYKIL